MAGQTQEELRLYMSEYERGRGGYAWSIVIPTLDGPQKLFFGRLEELMTVAEKLHKEIHDYLHVYGTVANTK